MICAFNCIASVSANAAAQKLPQVNYGRISYDKAPEGFLWYNETLELEERNLKEKKERNKKKDKKDEESVGIQDWDKNIKALKKRVKNTQRRALDNPTFTNVLEAQKAQKEMMDKSRIFAEVWKHVALIDSGIANIGGSSNNLHRKIIQEVETVKIAKQLKQLSKEWALILEVEEDCPYCHAFVPIAKEFANRFGFQLLAASKSGHAFEGLAGVKNMGQLASYNRENITPVLYLIHANGKEVFPIARGVTAEEEIVANIYSIDKHERKLF